MFKRHDKIKSALTEKPKNDYLPVRLSEDLLNQDKRKPVLLAIKAFFPENEARYNSLVYELLDNLCQYCQLLPDSHNRHYLMLGGFLDYGLMKTEIALGLFQQYIVPDENDLLTEEQQLWRYVLLSAALLQGIGKFYTEFRVDCFNQDLQWMKTRNPLSENIHAGQTRFYTYTQTSTDEPVLNSALNPMIAKFIMPKKGMDWISANPKAFAVWILLLQEEHYRSGTLGFILDRARAELIQSLHKQNPHLVEKAKWMEAYAETYTQQEYEMGVDFLQWLQQSLQSGQLILDKTFLVLAKGGLLLKTEAFREFIKNNPKYKAASPLAIQKGFLALQLHENTPEGNPLSRHEATQSQKTQEGIFISRLDLVLPSTLQLFDFNLGTIVMLSALDILAKIHSALMQFLSPTGLWEENKNPPPAAEKGFGIRGG